MGRTISLRSIGCLRTVVSTLRLDALGSQADSFDSRRPAAAQAASVGIIPTLKRSIAIIAARPTPSLLHRASACPPRLAPPCPSLRSSWPPLRSYSSGTASYGFLRSHPAPAIESVIEQHIASRCARSSLNMRDSPSEAARKPAASGTSSSRAVSAARTIVARRPSTAEARPNSSSMMSKLQRSPRSLQNTPSISKGTAWKRSATATPRRGHEQDHRFRSDEATNQPGGHAMRSAFGT